MKKIIGTILALSMCCLGGEYIVKKVDCFLYNDVWEMPHDASFSISVETDMRVMAMYIPDFTDNSSFILIDDTVAQMLVSSVDKYLEWRTKAINMGRVEVHKHIVNTNTFGAEKQWNDTWETSMLPLEMFFFTGSNKVYYLVLRVGKDREPCIMNKVQALTLKASLTPEARAKLFEEADKKQGLTDTFN